MTAELIAKALGGRKIGSGWSARCPTHDDSTPSLSLRDTSEGKVLVRCHAGCNQDQVIAYLKASDLWPQSSQRPSRHNESRRLHVPPEPDRDDLKRSRAALFLWQTTRPAFGTLIESYLKSRGIRLPITPTIRFHPHLKHPSGDYWPAMIALVTRGTDNEPLAIHRTFIAHNGTGKAMVESQKMMLGPCRGGAVRLAEPKDFLMIGEGIETCLAAMQETGYPAWAALSTSGMRALDLPKSVHEVIVLADGDEPGEAAAQNCALRWKSEGRRVRIARPPKGMDFNDMLTGRMTSKVRDSQ
jgi:putative DNA primase/helicase